jgi:hypothetical protein
MERKRYIVTVMVILALSFGLSLVVANYTGGKTAVAQQTTEALTADNASVAVNAVSAAVGPAAPDSAKGERPEAKDKKHIVRSRK